MTSVLYRFWLVRALAGLVMSTLNRTAPVITEVSPRYCDIITTLSPRYRHIITQLSPSYGRLITTSSPSYHHVITTISPPYSHVICTLSPCNKKVANACFQPGSMPATMLVFVIFLFEQIYDRCTFISFVILTPAHISSDEQVRNIWQP